MTDDTPAELPPGELTAGDRWLTKKEAAAQLGISGRQLDRWVAAGRLPKFQVANRTHVRYRQSDVSGVLALANPE